jgi:predicted PurR-regulated permease PerM
MRVVTIGLCLAAAAILAPFWAALVLAVWFADLFGPAQRRLEGLFGGKRWGAASIVVLLALGVLLPLTGIALGVGSGARQLVEQVRAALEGRGSLGAALLGAGGDDAGDLAALATRYGENVWRTLTALARASATAALAVVVFVTALYTFLADGERAYAWLGAHAPVPREAFDRLASAFRETGRGLLVAGGGTALVQGAIATVAYVAIGIPRPLLLGPLTAACAIVPAIGTAVVWLPLAIGLAVSGEYARAALLAGAGVIIGVVDNFVRPVLARHGRLRLPTFVVLISMLGGVALLGPTGALLGPLVVRLAVEAVEIISEESRSSGPDDRRVGEDERNVEAGSTDRLARPTTYRR